HVMVLEVRENALDVVDLERASDALCGLAGPHHEMLDEELAAAVEQIGERHLSVRPIENVLLLHLDPREVAAFAGQAIAEPRELLLLGQKCGPPGEPFVSSHDSVRLHGSVSLRSGLWGCLRSGLERARALLRARLRA